MDSTKSPRKQQHPLPESKCLRKKTQKGTSKRKKLLNILIVGTGSGNWEIRNSLSGLFYLLIPARRGGAIISQPAKPYPPMPYVTAFSGRRTYILCPPISYSSDKVGWTLARFPIDFLLKEMLKSLRKGLNP